MLLFQVVRLSCPPEKPYYNASAETCVKRCGSALYMNISAIDDLNLLVCVNKCPKYMRYDKESTSAECVSECDGYLDSKTDFCVSDCKLGYYYVNEYTNTKICINRCPKNLSYNV